MAETGFVLVGAGSDGGGSYPWVNPGNIALDDTSTAGFSGNTLGTNTSNQLRGSNLGFSVPAGATIVGIEVNLARYAVNVVKDNTVRLMVAGAASGNNLADGGSNWPGSVTSRVYGSASELWGLSLTPAIVNASNFGVVLIATGTNKASRPYCERVWVNVHYTVPSSIYLGSNLVSTLKLGTAVVVAAYLGSNKVF